MNIYIKWFLVVWFNTLLGFLWGYNNQGELYLAGMILGVMTWYLVYVYLDYLLIKSGRHKESRRLFISALIRIPLQLITVTDFVSGFAAVSTLQFLGMSSNENKLIDAYSMTVLTGFYLSLVCSVIFLLLTAIEVFLNQKNIYKTPNMLDKN